MSSFRLSPLLPGQLLLACPLPGWLLWASPESCFYTPDYLLLHPIVAEHLPHTQGTLETGDAAVKSVFTTLTPEVGS